MKLMFLCFFTSFVVLLFSQNLSAKTIEEGIWTGTITHPDGMSSEVRYDVKIIGFTLSKTITSQTMGDLPLDEIGLGMEKLSFSYFTGSLVNRSPDLRNNGSYSCHCKGTDRAKWRMRIIPPKH